MKIKAILLISAVCFVGIYFIYNNNYERYTNPLRYNLRQADKIIHEIDSVEIIINRIEGEKLGNPLRKDLDSEKNKMEQKYNHLAFNYTSLMEHIRKKYNRNDIEREGKYLDNEGK